MAWAEMSGTKTIDSHGQGPGAHYTDFIISFIGVEGTDNLAAALPIPGDLYTDVVSGGTLDSAHGTIAFDAEPSIIQVGESHKLTEIKCRVTCRFRGWHQEP